MTGGHGAPPRRVTAGVGRRPPSQQLEATVNCGACVDNVSAIRACEAAARETGFQVAARTKRSLLLMPGPRHQLFTCLAPGTCRQPPAGGRGITAELIPACGDGLAFAVTTAQAAKGEAFVSALNARLDGLRRPSKDSTASVQTVRQDLGDDTSGFKREAQAYYYCSRQLCDTRQAPGQAAAEFVQDFTARCGSLSPTAVELGHGGPMSECTAAVDRLSRLVQEQLSQRNENGGAAAAPGAEAAAELAPWLHGAVEKCVFTRVGWPLWQLYESRYSAEDAQYSQKVRVLGSVGGAALLDALGVGVQFRGWLQDSAAAATVASAAATADGGASGSTRSPSSGGAAGSGSGPARGDEAARSAAVAAAPTTAAHDALADGGDAGAAVTSAEDGDGTAATAAEDAPTDGGDASAAVASAEDGDGTAATAADDAPADGGDASAAVASAEDGDGTAAADVAGAASRSRSPGADSEQASTTAAPAAAGTGAQLDARGVSAARGNRWAIAASGGAGPYERAAATLSQIEASFANGRSCVPREAVEVLALSQLEMRTCALEASGGKAELFSMDDIMPVFIFVLVRSSLTRPFAFSRFMADSLGQDQRLESEGRAVLLLESAARHVAYDWDFSELQGSCS